MTGLVPELSSSKNYSLNHVNYSQVCLLKAFVIKSILNKCEEETSKGSSSCDRSLRAADDLPNPLFHWTLCVSAFIHLSQSQGLQDRPPQVMINVLGGDLDVTFTTFPC